MRVDGDVRLRFGDYELDSRSGKLLRGGRPVKIQPQPLRVLGILAERRGEIVSREQLRDHIWGDATFVEFDQGLNYCIRQIRIALRDEASEPAYIETLPKQGYRFIAAIVVITPTVAQPPSERKNGGANHAALPLTGVDAAALKPSTANGRRLLKPAFALPAALAGLIIIAGGMWLHQRSERQRWAREVAIPEIARLTSESQSVAAYRLTRQAAQELPGDPQLASMERDATRLVSVDSTPAGAQVEIQDYLSPDRGWLSLGSTPLAEIKMPDGYFRWKLSKPGFTDLITAPVTAKSMHFQLDAAGAASGGMVQIDAGPFANMIDFVGWFQYDLPAFRMDRFEVTNRQYQEFLDRGGYTRREYWKEKFVKDGKELSWVLAMDLFRDSTDRPGPATWEGGHFPKGQAEYPVSGVSWYEAAAYAVFAHKSLPAMGQWYKAAPSTLARFSINQSNFGQSNFGQSNFGQSNFGQSNFGQSNFGQSNFGQSNFGQSNFGQSNFGGHGLMPVGASNAVGPYGTYDMVGNVREWVWNAIDGDRRFILGGAWRTQTYQAFDPEALPPLDRSPLNGFRCVLNSTALPAAVTAPVVRRTRDFTKAKPVSDEVFQAYKSMYAYDRTPLNAKSEGAVENTADWTKEKITIDSGDGRERLPVYLFLPKTVHPPFQTVLFFPSARVEFMPSSQSLGDLQFVDYIIKSGRALVYPIYLGTYERQSRHSMRGGSIEDRELVITHSKEVRRSIDFLETRPEIDKTRLSYLGVSVGTAYGVMYTALEDRLKAIVFLDGGFFLAPALRGKDQVDFAPRVKQPVLMVNGRYDFTFSPERAQLPLFNMLGTPLADKKRVVFDTPHDISQEKSRLSREVLAWLDKYLGRVN